MTPVERRAPRWIVFDYGQVISLPTDAVPRMAACLGQSIEAFTPAYFAGRPAYDVESDHRKYWSRVAGLDLPSDLVSKLVAIDEAGWSQLDADAVALIEELAADGRPLALLSNAPQSFAQWVRSQPWAQLFSVLIFSGEEGVAKPEPAIFDSLRHRLGPGEAVFFDDRQDNVDAATAAGLTAHRWTTASDARELLRD